MFQVHCPAHRSQVLLTARRITVMVNTLDGVVVHWRCWCGHPGRSLMGRRLDGPSPGTPAHAHPAGGRDARGDGCSGCPDGTWPAAS
jgi:hypothetical protein